MIHKAGQKLVYPKEYAVVQQASAAIHWWTGAYAAYDFTAATYAVAKLDLTGNGRHATDGAAHPTHAAGVGCTFNGTTQYLITPVLDTTIQTAIIKYSGLSGLAPDGKFLFGAQLSSGSFNGIGVGSTNTNRVYRNGSALLSIAGVLAASGKYGISGTVAYINGAAETGSLPNDNRSGYAIYIGARNVAGVVGGFIAVTTSSLYLDTDILTLAQVATIMATMP